MKNCFYVVCTTNTSMLENKTNLPEGGPTSCCIPFSRMLIFPSTGGRKTPDNTEQVDRRRRTGTEPAGRACAALRGGSSTGPPCSVLTKHRALCSLRTSVQDVPVTWSTASQLALLVPTDSSWVSQFRYPFP